MYSVGGGSDGVGSVGGSGGGAGAGGTGDCTSRGPTGQQHYHPDGKRRSQRHRNLSITGRFLNYLKRRFNPVQVGLGWFKFRNSVFGKNNISTSKSHSSEK
ncbi:Hypothetical protein CINCED_3A006708 [Cinara cedri]|uniref:Uncharacterized protein n=1 Tax=Cinara cedri TaxID=506608 RepID=A0A5E4MCC9_9HEMI|nr:Hypothetical protein CINCED_3A006708 [Cinara cedri]